MSLDRAADYAAVDRLAQWSDWADFDTAALTAPRVPGVYQVRTRDEAIVYVGMAGERRGQGIRGRLSIYRRGKGAVSGFGEAALDRALADADFVEDHLRAVRAGRPARASVWAQDAIRWLDVEVRWAQCATQAEALALETDVVEMLKPHSIWNRVASRTLPPRPARSVTSRTAVPDPGEPGSDPAASVTSLTSELGRADGGRAVRKALRAGFPDHRKGESWDPLTPAQISHIRTTLGR